MEIDIMKSFESNVVITMEDMMRCVLIGLATLAAFASTPAFAALLDARSSTVEIRCGGSPPDIRTNTKAINTAQCDLSTTGNLSNAIAEAYLETPEAFVETYASYYDAAISAEAKASIDIQLRINLDSTPPVLTPTIPVQTFVSAEVDLFGDSIGSASLTLTGPGYESGSVLAIAPPNLVSSRITADIVPDEVYLIEMTASCYSVASIGATVGHCLAIIDPLVFFDQAAFDAELGASSFNLADYYSIEVSSVVPVPASVWLFGSGLIGLIGIARRKQV